MSEKEKKSKKPPEDTERVDRNKKMNRKIHERIYDWLEKKEQIGRHTPDTKVAEIIGCDYNVFKKQISEGRAVTATDLVTYANKIGCTTDYLLGTDNVINDSLDNQNPYEHLKKLIIELIRYDAYNCGEGEIEFEAEYSMDSFKHINIRIQVEDSSLFPLITKYNESRKAFKFLSESDVKQLVEKFIESPR